VHGNAIRHLRSRQSAAVIKLSFFAANLATDQTKELQLEIPVFYARSQFFDVEGVPVSFGNCDSDEVPVCAAWDVSPPRRFDAIAARQYGAAISQRRFHEMVAETFAGL